MNDYRIRNRANSIFSDDDRPAERWPKQRNAGDERGFFERAGDEVRSWFGDDEAERRREEDARRHERESGGRRFQHGGEEDQWTGRPVARAETGRYERNQLGSQPERPSAAPWGGDERFGSHHDESYRRWRDEQIAALDREYDDYCKHRQQQFEQDFTRFRQNRRSPIADGGAAMNEGGAAQGAADATATGAAVTPAGTTGGTSSRSTRKS